MAIHAPWVQWADDVRKVDLIPLAIHAVVRCELYAGGAERSNWLPYALR